MIAQEFDALSPLPEEIEWARERCRADEHLFGLVLGLKCFQRLGYFPRDEQLPVEVIERVRTCLGLPEGMLPDAARRTAAWQRELIRDRVGAVCDPERARALAEQAIREEAEIKNHPPDLINVALELLVREGLELPGFSTLNEISARVRAEIELGDVRADPGADDAAGDPAGQPALEVVGGKSQFDWLKRSAGKASWSQFREQVAHMRWVASLGGSSPLA